MRTRSASTSGGRKRRMRGWNSRTSGDDRHLRVVLKPGPRQRPRTAASSGSRHNAPGFAGGYLLIIDAVPQVHLASSLSKSNNRYTESVRCRFSIYLTIDDEFHHICTVRE